MKRWWAAVMLFAAATAPVYAQDDRSALEDSMFAAPPGTAATAVTAAPASQPAEFPFAASALVERTEAAADKLAVGGQVYIRVADSLARDAAAGKSLFSSPNLADVYLDARPNQRVRAYARGRLRFDPTVAGRPAAAMLFAPRATTTQAQLDQLWLKFDAGRIVYFTVGKQPLKWGTGRFWNPSDFLNPSVRDPLAVFDERLGVTLVKVQVPFEARGVNLYAIGNLDGAAAPRDVGGAARIEWLAGATEWSLSAAARRNRPTILGADVSAGIWNFDVRGEAALRTRDAGPYWQGAFAVTPPTLPRPRDRRHDWIPQAVAGIETAVNYSDQDSVVLGAEYFYNDAGYDSANLYPWLAYAGGLRPLYLGRHYAAAYILLAGPGSWNDHTFILSNLSNLSDLSHLVRFDWRYNAHRYLSLDFATSLHYGRAGEFNFAVDLPPVAAVPQLARGITVAKPLLDVNAGARVQF